MGFYNLNPEAMKELQSPDAGELLHRDGGNIASVIARLAFDKPDVLVRIREYLERIVPGVKDFERIALGPRETLEFRQEVKGSKHPWKFYAANMSDGTLRALGALTAVTQLANRKMPVTLVGIEEPETALHPAAAGALMDALREAAAHTQVVVTSHSPDLLEQVDPSKDSLLVVDSREGTTRIAAPDEASRDAIRNHLYSAGDLLRMNQLEPDENELRAQEQMQWSFASSDAEDAES
jgi:predicted ATPase